jgi:hypothetical protein
MTDIKGQREYAEVEERRAEVEERRGKRGEANYKLVAGLGTRSKKFMRETCKSYINNEELTII